jgi:hypothetical protein
MKMGNACPTLRDITPTLILPPQGGGEVFFDEPEIRNNLSYIGVHNIYSTKFCKILLLEGSFWIKEGSCRV